MKIAVVGGGHNGLVAACYLGRAGHQVDLFERREILGGLCVTEEIFPNTKVASLAARYGMLRPHIIKDLNLLENGLEPYRAAYSSNYLTNGDGITMYSGTREGNPSWVKIQGLTSEQTSNWYRFWNDMSKGSEILSDLFDQEVICKETFIKKLYENELSILAENLFQESLIQHSQRYDLHNSQIAIIATMCAAHPLSVESLYEVIMFGTAKAFGSNGKWGYAKGGMGSIIDALSIEAQKYGIMIQCSTEIQSIAEESPGQLSLTTATGETKLYDNVILAVDPITAYKKLLHIPREEFSPLHEEIDNYRTEFGYAAVHLHLDKLPDIPALRESGREDDKLFHGQIDFTPTLGEIEDGYKEYKQTGKLPLSGINLHTNMTSAMDDGVTTDATHVWTIIHQYRQISAETVNIEQERDKLLHDTLERLSLWVTDLPNRILQTKVITPYDIKETYGSYGASCKHITGPDYVLDNLPWKHHPGYRTPLKNVFLSSAGTPPGAYVTGLPGYMVAHAVLEDLGEVS